MQPHRLSLLARFGYASGNLGKSTLQATLDYFLLYLLTEYWGLPAATAGLVVLITMAWDAACGPFVGRLVDQTSGRFGRHGPFLLVGAPICALSFWYLLAAPGVAQHDLARHALVAGLVFRTAFVACDVPHNALLTRLSVDAKDATLVSGLRFFFSCLGGTLVAYGAGKLIGSPSAAVARASLGGLAAVAGAIFAISLWIAWLSVRRIDPPRAAQRHAPRPEQVSLIGRRLAVFLLVAFLQAATAPVLAKALPYYAQAVLGDAAWSALAVSAIMIAQAVSILGWIWLGRRIGLELALVVAFGLVAAGALGLSAAPSHPPLALLPVILGGVGYGGVAVILWALLPQLSRAPGGDSPSSEALAAGLLLLALKGGAGLSAALLGWRLSAIGFQAGDVQSPGVAAGIRTVLAAIPALGMLLSGLAVLLGLTPRRP